MRMYVSQPYTSMILAGDAWTTAASLPLTLGWGKAVGYTNNYIYLAGGYDGANYLSSVYLYNISQIPGLQLLLYQAVYLVAHSQ